MRIPHLNLAVVAAILISASPGSGFSQDRKIQGQGPIKLKAELVQIDVLVTDRAGKPVSGLKREDFELYDNDKPQPIGHFAFEVRRTALSRDASEPQPSIPRSMSARDLKRVLAFVVDTFHMHSENLFRTKKMLENFVDNQMQPGDLVLILATGGGSGLLQQFTSDRELLHRAIDRLRPLGVETGAVAFRSISEAVPIASERAQVKPIDSLNRGSGRLSMPSTPASGQLDPMEEIDIRATLETLDDMIKSMRQLPGRKLAVFVSQGFRISHTPARQDLSETIGLAARSNVVFYSIDPKGLVAPFSAADQMGVKGSGSFEALLARNRIDSLDLREPLATLASETGGTFFQNNNDINRGLANLLDDNSEYYLLGFQPEPERWDDKLHKIKVAVRNRPDLTVHSRRSYLARSDAPKPATEDSNVAEAIDAISSPFIRRDIDLRLTTLYVDDAQRDALVTLLLHVDASKLHFIESEGNYRSSLERIGFILDSNGRTVDKFSDTLEMNLRPATYQTALKNGIEATRVMSLKPGMYQIRLFVREPGSGLIGTAIDVVEIPDLKADRLAASSLFLAGEARRPRNTAGPAGVAPSQRRFPQNGELSYSLIVYHAATGDKAKQPQLEMLTRISRGNAVVFAGQPRQVAAGEGSAPPFRTVTGGVIKPLALPAGDYTLEVVILDRLRKRDNIIRREIDFTVEGSGPAH